MSGTLKGNVVSVTDDGDLLTDIKADALDGVPTDERVAISCGGHTTLGIFPVEHGQPEMTFLAVFGQTGQLQLSLVGENASNFLAIRPGAQVVIKW